MPQCAPGQKNQSATKDTKYHEGFRRFRISLVTEPALRGVEGCPSVVDLAN